jgi:hypothetical protein
MADPEPLPRVSLLAGCAWAALVAALAAVLFLGAALLPGRAPMPFPPENYSPLRQEALARGSIAPADLALGSVSQGDKYNQSLAWDRISRDRLRAGDVPQWTRDIGGGAPFVPQMGQVYMPWTWLLALADPTSLYGPWYFAHQVLLGVFAYAFLRQLGVGHAPGLVGVVAAVLGLWTQARVHHNVILSAALPLFPMLLCASRLCRGGGPGTAAGLALGAGVSWLGGFPPVALQMTYLTAGWTLCEALRRPRGHRLRPCLWAALALALGVGVGAAQLGPVLAAAADTARAVPTAAHLAAHAMSPWHALSLLWPDLLAWSAEHYYSTLDDKRLPWAALLLLDFETALNMNYPETAFAVGVPALTLALAATGRGPQRAAAWFFAGAGLLGFLGATATPGILEATALVPGLRAGDLRRLLFLPAMALPVLAAIGADRVARGAAGRLPARFAAAACAASALLALAHLMPASSLERAYAHLCTWRHAGAPGVSEETFLAAVKPDEGAVNRSHLLRTFGLAAASALAAFLACTRWRGPRGMHIAAAATLLELWLAGRGTIVAVEAERLTTPPATLAPALAATRAAPGPRPRFQRLAADDTSKVPWLLPANLGAYYGLEDLAAYNPLPPARMEELFGAVDPGAVLGGAGVNALRRPETVGHPLLDELGLVYLLSSVALPAHGLVDRTPPGTPLGGPRLYERTTCLPRAVFSSRVEVIPDKAARLARLADRARDPRVVVLEDPSAPVPAAQPAAADAAVAVDYRRYADEEVVLGVGAPHAGYLRLADPWDAGWTATVDGAPAPLLVADHYVRAVYLEPGPHEVVLRYDGAAVRWPPRFSLLALGAVLLLGAAAVRRRRR